MTTTFPGVKYILGDTKTDSTQNLGDHAAHHNDLADTANATQDKLGAGASFPTTPGDVLTTISSGMTAWAAPPAFADRLATAPTTYYDAVMARAPDSFWPLDDNQTNPTITRDVTGAAQGAYTGTPTLQARPIAWGIPTSVSFDGSNDLADMGAVYTATGLKPYSIAGVFTPGAVGALQTLCSAMWVDGSSHWQGHWTIIQADNTVAHLRYLDNVNDLVASTTTVASGTTYDYLLTYDGVIMTLYLNGALAARAGSSSALKADAGNHFGLGAWNIGNVGGGAFYFFTGRQAGTAWWNRALSAVDAAALHAARTAPTAPYPRTAKIFSPTDMNSDGSAGLTGTGKRQVALFDAFHPDKEWWMDTNATGGKPTGWTVGQYFRYLNRREIVGLYIHSSGVERTFWTDARAGETGYVIGGVSWNIDPRWLLCYNGTTLTGAINSAVTTIPVTQLSVFAVGDYALVGGTASQNDEVVHITAKSAASGAGNLTVTRGEFDQGGFRPATTHASGDWIRTIAWTFGDTSYFMANVTASCPSRTVAGSSKTWNEWVAGFLAAKLGEPGATDADGCFLDNFLDYATWIDNVVRIDRTNANTSSGITDLVWSTGMQDLATKIRTALPLPRLVIGNTGGVAATFGAWLNGGMVEGADALGQSGSVDAKTFLAAWATSAQSPKASLWNATSYGLANLAATQANYQAVRYNLALCCALTDAYFAYDEYGFNGGHQLSWWYDEYDAGGLGHGWLGLPTGAATQPITGVYLRYFDGGVVLANTTGSSQTVTLSGRFRRILGTQAPSVNSGAVVLGSVAVPSHDGLLLVRQG